jgi:hypothetical protein
MLFQKTIVLRGYAMRTSPLKMTNTRYHFSFKSQIKDIVAFWISFTHIDMFNAGCHGEIVGI